MSGNRVEALKIKGSRRVAKTLFSMAASPGLEPRLTESESAVLPLDDEAIICSRYAYISQKFLLVKHFIKYCFTFANYVIYGMRRKVMTVSLFEKFMKMFAKSGINKNTSSREAEITNERGTVDSKTISINESPYLNLINQLSSAKPEVAAAAL